MALNTFSKSLLLVLLSFTVEPLDWPHSLPQSTAPRDAQKKAWDILQKGVQEWNLDKRANATQALGLTSKDSEAQQLAEKALGDKEPLVRAAAAKALGAMGSAESIPMLQKASSDKDISVALAAGHALIQLKDNSGYGVYYEVLAGERKAGRGLMAATATDQLNQLKIPSRAIVFAFDQGIGFLPYGGYGMEAVRLWKKRNTAPTRAAAARELAADPDPRSARALANAVSDKNWMVRAAALEAISKRGDPALLGDVEAAMSDKKDIVRYSAAAAVLHLTQIAQKSESKKP